MSAFGGKADMTFLHCTCPLLTQSGHWACHFSVAAGRKVIGFRHCVHAML